MKIIVFGASGKTGVEIVKQALENGHQVTAFVRDSKKLELRHTDLVCFQGDVLEAGLVEQAVSGQQAVISALGAGRPIKPGVMESAAINIIAAMKKAQVRRIISTSGAGVRAPEDQPQLIDHLMKGLLSLIAAEVLRDSAANVRVICQSDLDWTIVRFPRLVDGAHSRVYRVGYLGKNAGVMISRADGADFILKELADGEYTHKMPVVSY